MSPPVQLHGHGFSGFFFWDLFGKHRPWGILQPPSVTPQLPSVAVALRARSRPCMGMPCTQCARSAKFWMSANTRTLVLAPFHKFLVPYQGFFGFPSIWDVAYLNCQPFPPRRGPSTKCTQSTRPGSRRRHCRHCSEPRIRRGGSIRPAEYSSGQIVRAPKPWSTSR